MGKKVYRVGEDYFIIDDETGSARKIIIQDESSVTSEVYKKLLKIILDEKNNENK